MNIFLTSTTKNKLSRVIIVCLLNVNRGWCQITDESHITATGSRDASRDESMASSVAVALATSGSGAGSSRCGFCLFLFERLLVFFAKLFELDESISQVDESQVQFAAKVIRQPTIIVVQTEVRRTHLAHAESLLLEEGGRHRIAVILLGLAFLFLQRFDIFQNFL